MVVNSPVTFAAEQRPNHAQPLVQAAKPRGRVHPGRDELTRILPARTDPHLEPSAGDVVRRGSELRGECGGVEREQRDRADQADATGGPGSRCQTDEGVWCRPVEKEVLSTTEIVESEPLRLLRIVHDVCGVAQVQTDLHTVSLCRHRARGGTRGWFRPGLAIDRLPG
jgi:hypothetical protein